MEEQWKHLKENPNYSISNFGRFRNNKGKILNLNTNACGYQCCNISTGGKVSKVKIHRLVALYFVSNPYKKDTVNHINGKKLDNHFSNLEWLTRKEKIQHAFANNLMHNRKYYKNLSILKSKTFMPALREIQKHELGKYTAKNDEELSN